MHVKSISALSLLAVVASAHSLPPSSGSNDAREAGVKYLITFGDSYSQTGFNITLTKPSAANPLGNPALPGYTASGGLDWVGFLITEFNKTLTLSYNFAYGGATVDASLVAPYETTVLSFIDQIQEFNESIASKPDYAPWTSENTLAGVWLGVNDVGNSYYESDEDDRLTQVVTEYFDQLQVLYDAGIRKFVLLAAPPTNETPLMLANDATSNQELVSALAEFNDLLASNLASFEADNCDVTAKIVNTTIPFNTAISDPQAYGAPNATCFDADGTTCLWFNNYHPGIAIQQLVAAEVAATWGPDFFTCDATVLCD